MIMGMCIGCSPYNAEQSVITQAIAVLRRFGTDAHIYLPGVGMLNGLQAGNYIDSAGTTAATVDQPVGLVLDAAGGLGVELVTNGDFSAGTTGWAAGNNWSISGQSIVTNCLNSDINTGRPLSQIGSVAVGKQYMVSFELVANNFTGSSCKINFQDPFSEAQSILTIVPSTPIGKYQNLLTSVSPDITLTNSSAAPAGSITIDNISIREITGIHASQTTTSNKCILRQTGGRYNWVFDATDLLTATFPAGNESVTVIDALGTGQVTTTGVNVVGAYSMGPSVTLYGRMVIKGALSASELVLLQSYANRLAGL